MSSASVMRPAAASSVPMACSCARTAARASTMWYFGSSRSPANIRVRFSAARTSAVRSLPRWPAAAASAVSGPRRPGPPCGTAGPGPGRDPPAAGSWPGPRGCGPGPRTSGAPRGLFPPPRGARSGPGIRQARTARRRAAPGLVAAGQLRHRLGVGPAPANTAAAPASARIASASSQSARSISVVTLWGSPRSTCCSAPGPALVPSSFPAAASRAKPRAGSGRMLGTTGNSSLPRMRSTWSSRCTAVDPPAPPGRPGSVRRSALRGAAQPPAGPGRAAATPEPWPGPPPGQRGAAAATASGW